MAGKTLINGTAYTIKGGKVKVNGTNYAIKGGKTLIGGTVKAISFAKLPSAYQEVEYIHSARTDVRHGQYIKTGKSYSGNDEFIVDISFDVGNTVPQYFGCYVDQNWKLYPIGIATPSNCGYITIYYADHSKFQRVTDNTRYLFDVTITPDNQSLKVDGTLKYSSNVYVPANARELAILAENDGEESGPYGCCSAKLYGYIHKQGGREVLNLVPCYRKSDNVAGMYDLVNHTFFTNAGSGSFTVGPNV